MSIKKVFINIYARTFNDVNSYDYFITLIILMCTNSNRITIDFPLKKMIDPLNNFIAKRTVN